MRVYKCDPEKNTECSGYGRSCGIYCGMTTKKECSADGKPLTLTEQAELQRELDTRAADDEQEAE